MPHTIPARVSQRGRPVPEIIVDDEFRGLAESKLISISNDGYAAITVDRKKTRLHRHLWFLRYGTCPELIDHINGNKLDNRMGNLRAASGSLNQQNQFKKQSDGCQEFPLGVVFIPNRKEKNGRTYPRPKPYRAMICFRGKRHFLGLYATPEEAGAVYQAMKFMLMLVESALCL